MPVTLHRPEALITHCRQETPTIKKDVEALEKSNIEAFKNRPKGLLAGFLFWLKTPSKEYKETCEKIEKVTEAIKKLRSYNQNLNRLESELKKTGAKLYNHLRPDIHIAHKTLMKGENEESTAYKEVFQSMVDEVKRGLNLLVEAGIIKKKTKP